MHHRRVQAGCCWSVLVLFILTSSMLFSLVALATKSVEVVGEEIKTTLNQEVFCQVVDSEPHCPPSLFHSRLFLYIRR